MIALVLATLLGASFALVVRWGLARKANLLSVGAINYAFAAVAYAVMAATDSWRAPAPVTLLLGAATGTAFVLTFLLLMSAMRLRGVSVPSALTRLSVLIPIGFSVFLWNERPSAIQMCGIALALISLPLLSYRPGESLRVGWREYLLLLGLFVMNGVNHTLIKGFREYGSAAESVLFFLCVFLTAAVVCAGVHARRGERLRRADWTPGLLLGACNVLGNLMLLRALQQVPAVVVFPFNSAVGLLYAVFMARRLWGERVGPLERAGILLAILSVLLVRR